MLPLLLLACSNDPEDSAKAGDEGEDTDTGLETIGGDDTGTDPDDSGEDTDDGEDPDEAAAYAALYDASAVQRFDLTIDASSIEALRADPDTYVAASLDYEGVRLDSIGVRLRGEETWDGKPGFRLKLNEFVAGQRYAGVERILLDAMQDDRTQARAVLAGQLWQSAGLVAPRANWAQVYVNGELFGLYANIEAIDEHFLPHHYADDEGDLWEAEDSADFTGYGVTRFDLVSGEGDMEALEAARRAVWDDDTDLYTAAGAAIDMDAFLDLWAWSITVGTDGAYPYQLEDFSLVTDPEDGRFDLAIPALDGAWDSGMEWDATRGSLGYRCLADDACKLLLRQRTDVALATFATLDPQGLAEAGFLLTDTAIVDDPRRTFTANEVQTARTTLVTRFTTWPERVRYEMGI